MVRQGASLLPGLSSLPVGETKYSPPNAVRESEERSRQRNTRPGLALRGHVRAFEKRPDAFTCVRARRQVAALPNRLRQVVRFSYTPTSPPSTTDALNTVPQFPRLASRTILQYGLYATLSGLSNEFRGILEQFFRPAAPTWHSLFEMSMLRRGRLLQKHSTFSENSAERAARNARWNGRCRSCSGRPGSFSTGF